jgi:hypothetical protein
LDTDRCKPWTEVAQEHPRDTMRILVRLEICQY